MEPGAVVNLTIRSGTNRLSGSLFEYYRDDSLNARNFFAATKAPFNSHQFGGTVGGPIRKNRAFFFGDFQALRQDQGRTFLFTVPTAEMRTGNLSDRAESPAMAAASRCCSEVRPETIAWFNGSEA